MKFIGEELPTGFIGRSPRIVQIREQLARIGFSRTPVLIQGESGTGKEVAARVLYTTQIPEASSCRSTAVLWWAR